MIKEYVSRASDEADSGEIVKLLQYVAHCTHELNVQYIAARISKLVLHPLHSLIFVLATGVVAFY